jgi:SGNH hydrolase-like domain, acetyltransferase AlgX
METPTRRPSRGLGYVVPRLLAVLCLLDIGLRFTSVDPFTFRAWEAMSRYRPPGAAFEPNRQYRQDHTYGDAAAMGNMPGLRQYRREVFTTDALGFRNAGDLRSHGVAAIMIGDSSAVGSGVSDEETLPARLTALSGCGVYNAGSEDAKPDPDRVIALSQKLGMRGGLVIHLYSEIRELPTVAPTQKRRMDHLWALTPDWVSSLVARIRGIITVSPLRILSERALKALENGQVLPNSYAANVVKAAVNNGDTMLFPAAHVRNFYAKRDVGVGYWTWLQTDLRRENLDLLVLLVPGKYSVYRPFLVDQPSLKDGVADYLAGLERELRAARVPVLNLAPMFAAQAAAHLARHDYLYWLDDTHWNAQGIDLAAAAIHAAWPLAESPCSPDHIVSDIDGRRVRK